MKTITLEISDPVYEDFQSYARRVDRAATELMQDAVNHYRQSFLQRSTTLRDRRPASVGGPIQPVTAADNLLEEMLHDSRS
jgi:hypothetical protein